MADGYTRQSAALIVDGGTVHASHHNNEYNAIESAFNASTGHTHDGTVGGGAPVLFSSLASKPTTLTGYGITDGTPSSHISTATGVHGVTGSVVGTDNTQTLINKTMSGANNTFSNIGWSAIINEPTTLSGYGITDAAPLTHVSTATGVHGVTGTIVGTTDTQTLTNKTIALGSNTVSGTVVQFNTALTDADFYTTGGTDVAIADGGTGASTAANARTNLGLGNVENTALSTWAGSANITTVGTIATGTWSGTAVAVAKGGTGATDAATARTNLGLAIGTNVQAYNSATALTSADQTWTGVQRATIGTLTDGVTITPDFSAYQDFTVTLSGNRTMANPTNITAGQKGSFIVRQDATGSRTLTYGSYYKWPGGSAPVLTTTANAVDRIHYHVISATEIHCAWSGDFK